MKQLCIDIGNTSVHYGLVDGRRVTQTGHFPTANLRGGPSSAFYDVLAPLLAQAAGIAFCSVVPEVNTHLQNSLTPANRELFHLTHETCRGLGLIYPKPAEIGQDRLANALAAQAYYGVPAIVIDMGTAVTFDVVSTAGYEGGIIAPGLAVMRSYLYEQTALLPKISEDELVGIEGGIGKSTAEAMRLGVAVGFSGMIDALLRRVKAELQAKGEPDSVVLSTGGTSAHLTSEWMGKSEFVEDLTLLGLAVAASR
jgi:type III pantothenate kinase